MDSNVFVGANRRDFLKGALLTGAAAMTGGCAVTRGGWLDFTAGAPMHGYAAPMGQQAQT